ncbi:MAG: DUF721 domain-containing protein [Actinomycetota bacterium]
MSGSGARRPDRSGGDHDDRWGRDPYRRKRVQQERRRAGLDREHRDDLPTDDDDTVEDEDRVRKVPSPRSVSELLGGVVRSRGWEERLGGAQLENRWTEVVGADLARRCEPVRFAGGTLVVRAENRTWATQLRYMTGEIRMRADRVLGEGTVRQVRITVGPLGS